LLKKQEISQPEKERNFEVNYSSFQEFPSAILPTGLTINALQKTEKTAINIDYNSITFNEELNFPYSVPNGYDRIYIKTIMFLYLGNYNLLTRLDKNCRY
jgi:hypothetical protein